MAKKQARTAEETEYWEVWALLPGALGVRFRAWCDKSGKSAYDAYCEALERYLTECERGPQLALTLEE